MHTSLRDTFVFLALASVIFLSFGFLIVALIINRRQTQREPPRSADRD